MRALQSFDSLRRTATSLFPLGGMWLGAFALAAAVAAPLRPLLGVTGHSLLWLAAFVPFLVAMMVAAVWTVRRWRASLPFEVEGFEEALAQDAQVLRTQLTVHFAAQSPLSVELPAATTASRERLTLLSPSWSPALTNRPFAAWFRDVVGGPLRGLHVRAPIRCVQLKVLAAAPFSSADD